MSPAPIFVLAIDHRNSLRAWYRATTGAPPRDATVLRAAKEIVLDGMLHAISIGLPKRQAVLLADEEYGVAAIRRARENGIATALAVERSGQPEFSFEYGDRFGEHIQRSRPDIVKALVRYNPEGDGPRNARSRDRLWELAQWLERQGLPLMLELLVPAEPGQRARAGEGFDVHLRPALTVKAMRELAAAGLRPRYWKIEGQPTATACQEVAAAASAGGCLVLGRGEDATAVARWLTLASPIPGFSGFAIGRTIWAGPLARWARGRLSAQAAAELIGERYVSFAWLYLASWTPPGGSPG
jgi:myo-inositol catabolism protein IolC